MAVISANIHAADGAALDERLDAMAATVCEQRSAHDAAASRRCRGRWPAVRPAWPASAGSRIARPPRSVPRQCCGDPCVAEQATIDGTSDQPGYLPGFGILPAESVRDLADRRRSSPCLCRRAARSGISALEGAEFVRWRDLTCRWPGCDAPVERCDIDHTVPWPFGPTHPSNIKPYCRIHHLIKTSIPARAAGPTSSCPTAR